MQAKPTELPQLSRRHRRRLLADLLTLSEDLETLARRHKMSVDQLAHWMRKEEVADRMLDLAGLADAQTQLALARVRINAVARLHRLATSEAAGETARRACADLLKYSVLGFDPRSIDDINSDDANPLTLRQFLYGLSSADAQPADPTSPDSATAAPTSPASSTPSEPTDENA